MIDAKSGFPAHSSDALAALDVFYEDFNEVNFYVEDADHENLYYELLKKLFRGINFARVFPLGGKEAVFAHALSGANTTIRNPRIYIVDRDFDHMLGQAIVDPSVFYLDNFCIENHLLEADALLEIVIENHPKSSRLVVAEDLSFVARIAEIYASLRPLFILFFCAQSLHLAAKNTSLPPEAFCKKKRLWELNENSIDEYLSKLNRVSLELGHPEETIEEQRRMTTLSTSNVSNEVLVSGKFIAAMLFHYVKGKYSLGSMTFDSFIYRLGKNCTLESMNPLAQRIRSSLARVTGAQ